MLKNRHKTKKNLLFKQLINTVKTKAPNKFPIPPVVPINPNSSSFILRSFLIFDTAALKTPPFIERIPFIKQKNISRNHLTFLESIIGLFLLSSLFFFMEILSDSILFLRIR